MIILSGRVSVKMAPVIRRIYDQMLEPKWVIAMGACSSSAGMFNNYALVQGADKFLPVDVYVPGCPPRPEALIYGINKLQKMIWDRPDLGWRERYKAEGTEEPRDSPRATLPDATGLELVAQRVRDQLGDEAVAGTAYHREQATLEVAPRAVHDVLAYLKQDDEEPYPLLTSVHGCDYLPDEPRFGVHYELLSMERTERLSVKTRVGADDPTCRPSSTSSPAPTSRSARSTTCSASSSTATRTCAGS